MTDYSASTGAVQPLARNGPTAPVITPAESAHSLVLTIEQLKPEQNGKFLGRDGTELPW